MAAAAAEAGKGSPNPGDATITGDDKGGAPAPKDDKGGKSPDDKGKTPEQLEADQKAADQQAKDDKAASDKAAADKAKLEAEGSKDGDGKPKPKAPDKYELSIPDAAEGFIDDTDVAQISAIAKSAGWTNEEAQAALEQHADTLAENSARYRAETAADPVLGGDNLAETTRLARQGLEWLAPSTTDDGKALRRVLAKSGMGNNRLVVGALRKLGLATAEDQPLGSGAGGDAAKMSTAEKLYGKDGGVKS